MLRDLPQVTLLRVAAFLVDALAVSLVPIVPASLASYLIILTRGPASAISVTWAIASLVVLAGILFRDGMVRRSWGKRLLGLRLVAPEGRRCGYLRSAVRNLPLIIPGWNVLELAFVLFSSGGRRTGDRLAGTSVIEE